jgi:hypothetical protein
MAAALEKLFGLVPIKCRTFQSATIYPDESYIKIIRARDTLKTLKKSENAETFKELAELLKFSLHDACVIWNLRWRNRDMEMKEFVERIKTIEGRYELSRRITTKQKRKPVAKSTAVGVLARCTSEINELKYSIQETKNELDEQKEKLANLEKLESAHLNEEAQVLQTLLAENIRKHRRLEVVLT